MKMIEFGTFFFLLLLPPFSLVLLSSSSWRGFQILVCVCVSWPRGSWLGGWVFIFFYLQVLLLFSMLNKCKSFKHTYSLSFAFFFYVLGVLFVYYSSHICWLPFSLSFSYALDAQENKKHVHNFLLSLGRLVLVYIYIYIYIHTYTYIPLKANTFSSLLRPLAERSMGWGYLGYIFFLFWSCFNNQDKQSMHTLAHVL